MTLTRKSKIAPAKQTKQVRFQENPITKINTYVATPKYSPFLRRYEHESDAEYNYRKLLHKDKEHSLRSKFVKDYVESIGAKTPVPAYIPTIGAMKETIQQAEKSVRLKSTKVWTARHNFVKNDDHLDNHGYVMESLFWTDRYLKAPPVPVQKPSLTTKITTAIRSKLKASNA